MFQVKSLHMCRIPNPCGPIWFLFGRQHLPALCFCIICHWQCQPALWRQPPSRAEGEEQVLWNTSLVPHSMSTMSGKLPVSKVKGIVTLFHPHPGLFPSEGNLRAVDSTLINMCVLCLFMGYVLWEKINLLHNLQNWLVIGPSVKQIRMQWCICTSWSSLKVWKVHLRIRKSNIKYWTPAL